MLIKTLLLTAPLALAAGPGDGGRSDDAVFRYARHARPTTVAVWTDRSEVIRRGERVRVFFETEYDAYVTVFRIDTDGRVEVLFPQGPWDNNFAQGGRRYEARSYGERHAFRGDPYPGAGYVFAVTSPYPFHYGFLAHGARWDYRELGYRGRVVGDPYVAVMDLVDLITPAGFDDYDYDIVHYYVERRVDYPRFLCYDCHAYASYADWDPYRDPCFRFRIVVYNDPYYYPLRAYGGAPVVFTRPKRLEPRYVFKERVGSRRDVTVESRRPVNDPGARRTVDRPATSRQFGGVGRVPTPARRGAADSVRRPAGGETPGETRRRPALRPDEAGRRPDRVRPAPRRLDPAGDPATRREAGARGRRPQPRPTLQPRTVPRRLDPDQREARRPPADGRGARSGGNEGRTTRRVPVRRPGEDATRARKKGKDEATARPPARRSPPRRPPNL